MTNVPRRFHALVAAFVLIVAGCGEAQTTTNSPSEKDGLVVLAGAVSVQRTQENAGAVLYDLPTDPYPAERSIQAIHAQLERAGWRLLEKGIFDGNQTSIVRGWSQYTDARKQPEREVFQWSSQWEDAGGRVVWYVLQFDGSTSSTGTVTPGGTLKVRATVISAAAVQAIRKR